MSVEQRNQKFLESIHRFAGSSEIVITWMQKIDLLDWSQGEGLYGNQNCLILFTDTYAQSRALLSAYMYEKHNCLNTREELYGNLVQKFLEFIQRFAVSRAILIT